MNIAEKIIQQLDERYHFHESTKLTMKVVAEKLLGKFSEAEAADLLDDLLFSVCRFELGKVSNEDFDKIWKRMDA